MKKIYKIIVCIGIALLVVQSCKKKSKSDGDYSEYSQHKNYIALIDKNVAELSPERKKKREEWINELKKNSVYIALVDSGVVSKKYLPTLNAISDAIKNSYKEEGVSQFGISEEIANEVENSETGNDKMNFVIPVSSLSLKMNGGMPKEIIRVFEKYKSKFNFYGNAGDLIVDESGNKIEIEKSYNLSYAFALFAPTDKKALNAIFESVDKGTSQWNEPNNSIYENGFMALKSDYMKHLKKVYSDSPYLIDVDFEITALDLYQAYEDNEVSADEKYKDKKIAVTGTIGSIGKDVIDNPYVSFKRDYLQGVTCYFSDENNKTISQLNKGQEITIIGECRGLTLTNVVIKDCKIN